MDVAQVKQLAGELETTLCLLAQLLAELESRRDQSMQSEVVRELVHRLAAQPDLADLPALLLQVHAEIQVVLGGIRSTREAIEAQAVERIRDSRHRLSSVTSTTESAALELLNGLDRSLELINSLETQSSGAGSGEGFQRLRDQVSALYNHLQFQDITAQQLQGVAQSLSELEHRVRTVTALFDQALHGHPARPAAALQSASSARLPYNPDATMHHSHADQAMIDAAFKGARHGASGQPAHDASPR
jgi:hypothetical protein